MAELSHEERARRLKAARALGGYGTPAALAEALPAGLLNESTIRRMESSTGRRQKWTDAERQAIAVACGVPASFFTASRSELGSRRAREVFRDALGAIDEAGVRLAQITTAAVSGGNREQADLNEQKVRERLALATELEELEELARQRNARHAVPRGEVLERITELGEPPTPQWLEDLWVDALNDPDDARKLARREWRRVMVESFYRGHLDLDDSEALTRLASELPRETRAD